MVGHLFLAPILHESQLLLHTQISSITYYNK